MFFKSVLAILQLNFVPVTQLFKEAKARAAALIAATRTEAEVEKHMRSILDTGVNNNWRYDLIFF